MSTYNNDIDVSVIIPCYNAEKNILKVFKSLEQQKYSNFEVIIVNDGSTDKTDNIIRSYLKKSNLNYKYLKQDNYGVSVARNKGIENSCGKYITFLDSDDIYHEYYLELLINMICNKNVDTVYCAYTRDILNINVKEKIDKNKLDIQYLNHKELMKNFMYRKGPCGFFNFIYKKSIINEYNIRFDENTKYGEDLEFVWKYLVHCKDGIFIKGNLYGYYDNPESTVNNINWRITDTLAVIKRVEEYMYKYNDVFIEKFKKYMYHRTVWAIAKDFSKNGNKQFFYRFSHEYNVKESMKMMLKNSHNIFIKVSSLIYCINKKYFYYILNKV